MWSDHCHSTFLQTRREYVCSYPPHLEVFGCADEALGCGAVTCQGLLADCSCEVEHDGRLLKVHVILRAPVWAYISVCRDQTISKCTLYCVLLCGHTAMLAGIRPFYSARYTVCSCVGTQQFLQGPDLLKVHVICYTVCS